MFWGRADGLKKVTDLSRLSQLRFGDKVVVGGVEKTVEGIIEYTGPAGVSTSFKVSSPVPVYESGTYAEEYVVAEAGGAYLYRSVPLRAPEGYTLKYQGVEYYPGDAGHSEVSRVVGNIPGVSVGNALTWQVYGSDETDQWLLVERWAGDSGAVVSVGRELKIDHLLMATD